MRGEYKIRRLPLFGDYNAEFLMLTVLEPIQSGAGSNQKDCFPEVKTIKGLKKYRENGGKK